MTSAVILAGGLGTRLRSAVPDLPKPMAPINGRPFLEYQMDYWIGQGIDRFMLSVGYRHEVIVRHFGNRFRDVPVDYVVEDLPLGTGGALLLAADALRSPEPFLVLNGDTYFVVDLPRLLEFASTNDADWCLSLFGASDESRYMGLEVQPNGRVTALASREGLTKLINGGVYVVHPRALAGIGFERGAKASLEADMLPVALGSGQRVFGVEFAGAFIDIGVPHDYYRMPQLLAG